MATHLHQLLRSLCWNTEWNYAVLWKLKHRARMVLTWEDGYFNNQFKLDPLESRSLDEGLDSLHDGRFANDSLGLAVAKMSYYVYSLGEGIVGQVAVTGKHQWIFAGEQVMNSLEPCDGWQAQFSAGIKTIVVAAVAPYGVVQLGSLNKVNENLHLLTHIRDVFSSLQESPCHIQTPVQHSLKNMQMSDTSSRLLDPDVFQNYVLDKATNKEHNCSTSAVVPSPQKHLSDFDSTSLSGVHLNEAVGLMAQNGLADDIGSARLVQAISGNKHLTDVLNDNRFRSISSRIQNTHTTNDSRQICSSSQSCLTENSALYDGKLSTEKSGVRFRNSPADFSESPACAVAVFGGRDHPSEEKFDKLADLDPLEKEKVENVMDIQPEFSCLDTLDQNSSFAFSAGTELHEALGPAFLKQFHPSSWELERLEDKSTSYVAEAMESSLLTSDAGTDHLLEAVVANFCRGDAVPKRAKSFSASESMLTTERMPEPSINTSHTIASSCYSIGCSSLLEESTQNRLNSSDSYSIRSSASACREPLVRSGELGKLNKKRARPGENSRPRPRDRQLIQDRIKELRELVPNGSKCSIDSLLERTIKHMVFMQSVTKHGDKLSNCAKSRGCINETGALGPNYEQGSSWAVEVGGRMKICPIVVENLSVNGQMLIEMLCEDCDHFLEIAEAIKSLGLTILKGITDVHGDKTWMRFTVEGQSNRNLHRMDVLWSLVQLLQTKNTV